MVSSDGVGVGLTCVVIGAGNVAWTLAPALSRVGVDVRAVYSRDKENAKKITEKIKGAIPLDSLEELPQGADLYVVATKDDAIAEIVKQINSQPKKSLWIHTSGSVDKSVFSSLTDKYGVLYPMQTFTKGIDVSLENVPFFIEGSSAEVLAQLREIAEKLSSYVFDSERETRLRIHAAAVFACNFVNYMWTCSDEILHTVNQDINLLFPLIGETWRKLGKVAPRDAQTGPARRDDQVVMSEHMRVLPEEFSGLYREISERICELYNGSNRLKL